MNRTPITREELRVKIWYLRNDILALMRADGIQDCHITSRTMDQYAETALRMESDPTTDIAAAMVLFDEGPEPNLWKGKSGLWVCCLVRIATEAFQSTTKEDAICLAWVKLKTGTHYELTESP